MEDLILSLFPGIGLLDMAFEQEGFCVVRGPDVLWAACRWRDCQAGASLPALEDRELRDAIDAYQKDQR